MRVARVGRLSQMPMSLVLNCESAAISTTAEEVSLPFRSVVAWNTDFHTVSGDSMNH